VKFAISTDRCVKCIAFKGQDQIVTKKRKIWWISFGRTNCIVLGRIILFFLKMSTVREWNRFVGKGQRQCRAVVNTLNEPQSFIKFNDISYSSVTKF
jgi:hypothetical protein